MSRGMFVFFEIGNRLREERERLGLSQPALADICGVTMRSQRNYEKGDRQPDASYLAAVSAAGADVLYILAGQRAGAALPSPISREEAALLDNYRHSSPEGKKAIKATSDALAKPSSGNSGKKSA